MIVFLCLTFPPKMQLQMGLTAMAVKEMRLSWRVSRFMFQQYLYMFQKWRIDRILSSPSTLGIDLRSTNTSWWEERFGELLGKHVQCIVNNSCLSPQMSSRTSAQITRTPLKGTCNTIAIAKNEDEQLLIITFAVDSKYFKVNGFLE